MSVHSILVSELREFYIYSCLERNENKTGGRAVSRFCFIPPPLFFPYLRLVSNSEFTCYSALFWNLTIPYKLLLLCGFWLLPLVHSKYAATTAFGTVCRPCRLGLIGILSIELNFVKARLCIFSRKLANKECTCMRGISLGERGGGNSCGLRVPPPFPPPGGLPGKF